MGKEHYPEAIIADEILDVIETQKVANLVFRYGYECLFIASNSTRPAMAFSLFPAELNSPEWKAHVVRQVGLARKDAGVGEIVYFDPD